MNQLNDVISVEDGFVVSRNVQYFWAVLGCNPCHSFDITHQYTIRQKSVVLQLSLMVEHNFCVFEWFSSTDQYRFTNFLNTAIFMHEMFDNISHFSNRYYSPFNLVIKEVEDRRFMWVLFASDGALVEAEEVEGRRVGCY